MPVTSITTDPAALTLTVVADYPVAVERLWAAWADPRLLERFWGPPQWPATFTRHELRPGGRSEYHMTGPNGECSRGYWIFDEVDPPRTFSLRDGFANADGTANDELPGTHMRVDFASTQGGSRFVVTSTFASLEALEQLVAMGMLEGLRTALGQLDATLDDPDGAALRGATTLERLGDDRAVIARVVAAPLGSVWRAMNEAEIVRRWMLGPEGWSMPVCETAAAVGDTYRYEWQSDADGQRFGFTGELVAQEPPRRAVSTERMLGVDGPGTVNELALQPLPGGRTRVVVTVTYASAELREIVLGTGMVDGMEQSYARLERVLATG
jgi:uncharacterized protein YndB with AHSA1/START domain